MLSLIISSWSLQGIVMIFDELYFHRKRSLPKWERIGHPIDTFLYLLCFIYTLFFQSHHIPYGFCALALISTIAITKDEWVHLKYCKGLENWLHALLFILHPISLFALYLAWENDYFFIIKVMSVIIFTFMIYQIIYWNIFRKPDETKN